ncbi:leucine-rich repeat domain-containing protein [Ningiella sp. W23]|uniref:leucine-rich repeat domain-containing protein n=1 Tax=Ningiella sp. W23 TaxID=3023715 RepID=UPI0037566333
MKFLNKSAAHFLIIKTGLISVVVLLSHSAYSISGANMVDTALSACVNSALEDAGLSDISTLTRLKCHKKGISDLSGIEALSGLEHLSLFANDITEADLSSLVHLRYLNLAKNKIERLNISGLQHLETLFLFKNELTELDLSGLRSVQKMRMMENKLERLDISELESLEEAYLWDNQLEDLDITALTNLRFLDVKQNPMPDELYDFYDEQEGITISHDGNADDWK